MEKYSCISFKKILMKEVFVNGLFEDKVIDSIYKKYGIKIELDCQYNDIVIKTDNSSTNDNGLILTVFDSNLTFKELLKWCKSMLDEQKDIYLDKYIYANVDGRKEEKRTKIEFTEDFDINSNICGFEIPYIQRSSILLKEKTPFQIGVFSDRITLQAMTYLYPDLFIGNLGIKLIYTSMTSDEIINWMNALINGKSIYSDREIVLEYNVDEASEKTKQLLSNCKTLNEFKNELNS